MKTLTEQDQHDPVDGDDTETHVQKAIDSVAQVHATLQDLIHDRVDTDLGLHAETKLNYEIYGSVKLGVSSPSSDVDVCFFGPHCITREIFFDLVQQNFDAEVLLKARVPLAKIKLVNRIELDVLYVQMPLGSRSASLQSLFKEDCLYRQLDESSIRSLCGPRTCNYLSQHISNPNWADALRLIRQWAQNRHLMSNVFGMPNSISYAIILALVLETMRSGSTEKPETQLTTEELVRYFFHMVNMWKWDVAEIRNLNVEPELAHIEWNGRLHDERPMHVITPCFPLVNTTHNVCSNTLHVWKQEVNRVYKKCFDLKPASVTAATSASTPSLSRKGTPWKDKKNPIHQQLRLKHFKRLSRPLKLKCKHFIVVQVINDVDLGLVRSKINCLLDLISQPRDWLIIPITTTIDDSSFLFGLRIINKSRKVINLQQGFRQWKALIKKPVECLTYKISNLPPKYKRYCKI